MKRSVALLLVFAASPAFAQPSAQPPAEQAPSAEPPPVIIVTPAPQNEDWNNVSHINGHPVKVGERGDYLYKWKKTNISTNPIGWIFGFYGVSAEQALSNNVAIRGDANIFARDSFTGYELGASLPIYFKRVYQGPFLEPGIIIRGTHDTYADDYCDVDCMNNDTFVGPEVLFGWHWTFDSGLNVAFAGGIARRMTNTYDYSDENVEGNAYFRVGYAF